MRITIAERATFLPSPVPTASSELARLRSAIEERLHELAHGDGRTGALDEAIRYVLLSPGKRVRPILTVLASWELGVHGTAALDAGCALEMVHAASLVLDDLPCMDDAARRRGRPSAHVAFGQDAAILTSVALLGRAFATAASAQGVDPVSRARLAGILAEAVGPDGLSGGQFEDLRGGSRQRAVDRIVDSNHLKTGVLFVAAVDMASAVAGANEVERERLRSFATHLGQAFQLMDDLSDGDGPTEGGEDAGKVTIVTMLGQEDSRIRLNRHLSQALGSLRPEGPLATFVSAMFELGHGKRSDRFGALGA